MTELLVFSLKTCLNILGFFRVFRGESSKKVSLTASSVYNTAKPESKPQHFPSGRWYARSTETTKEKLSRRQRQEEGVSPRFASRDTTTETTETRKRKGHHLLLLLFKLFFLGNNRESCQERDRLFPFRTGEWYCQRETNGLSRHHQCEGERKKSNHGKMRFKIALHCMRRAIEQKSQQQSEQQS